jgi:hypothetical protein
MASLPTASERRLEPSLGIARGRVLTRDPLRVALVAVFLCMSAFYLWRTNSAVPLSLDGTARNQYNQLAEAFLHLHLWIAHLPASVLGPEPLNPARRPEFLNFDYGEDALYHGGIYITWGPTPVLVLLVPLQFLGFEPSASVVMAFFTIVGLGFALAALRVSLKLFAGTPLWMSTLAAITLACASVTPYILSVSGVYHEAIAGGYCFTMAGIWLAIGALVQRRVSSVRLVLMSLCFGLAAGARPTLGLTALLLIPVYASLRASQSRRRLLITLVVPVGICFLLLGAYNAARFGSPLEIGTKYQLNGGTFQAHWGSLAYVPVGVWSYLVTPPRLNAIFPFVSMVVPPASYPLALPAHYSPAPEQTAGLIPMTPIAIFIVALPWMWRRRPRLLGPLGPLLSVMAGVGMGIMLFLSYEFFGTTERYEVDYMTLLLFGAVLLWLALASNGRHRRSIRLGGGLLAVWSCVCGMALAYQGLQVHPDIWRKLVDVGSPVSSAIATVAGHPILAEVYTPNVRSQTPESYGNIGTDVTGIALSARNQADLTIVSPNSSEITVVAKMSPGPGLTSGTPLEARLRGPGLTSVGYRVPSGGGTARLTVHLTKGVNRFVLGVASGVEDWEASALPPPQPESQAAMLLLASNLHLANG